MDDETTADEFELDDALVAWGLALAVGLEPEPADRCPALDELGDALLVQADEHVVDRLTAPAVAALWTSELETLVREGLAALIEEPGWDGEPQAALADLDRRGRASPIASAVVCALAQSHGFEALDPFFCTWCLDARITRSPPGERRRIACEAGAIAVRDVDIDDAELRRAARAAPGSPFATALATDERRAAMRTRLRRVARLGASTVPALAAELEAMLVEPPPRDPGADGLWTALCAALCGRLEVSLN